MLKISEVIQVNLISSLIYLNVSEKKLSDICSIIFSYQPLSENKRDNCHPETWIVLKLPAVRSVLSFGPHRHLDEPQ